MAIESKSPLERAKEAHGGAAGLAAALSKRSPDRPLTGQAISQWKQVPADRCLDVEAITGISRHDLRPTTFGPATPELAKASA
jgi:DNA-binding transcriptional regulator YdaS (Cro superfamily)